jgi:sugar transferase (PEP-CTERM/EpsH1 system associated)
VTVASLARSQAEQTAGEGIANYCFRFQTARVFEPIQKARMIMRAATLTPCSMGFFYSALLDRSIRQLLGRERFDLIFVHCSSVAQYVAHVRNVPKILDFGDMDSQKWLAYADYKPFPVSAGYWLEGKKLERAEKQLARSFDLCTATTRAEWETLESYRTGTLTDWFPNGVDIEYFAPSDQPYDPDTICFVGRMDYYPNQECVIDFCARTLPLIRQRRPATKLVIIGADPSPSVKRLSDLSGVTVTGFVQDVRPLVHQCAAMVAPLNIARGTQNKILETLALGVPVVASRRAAGGVDAVTGQHFLTAASPQAYADALISLMQNPDLRGRLAHAGRRRMQTHHSWQSAMKRLDGIVERCISHWTTSGIITSIISRSARASVAGMNGTER